MLVTVRCTVFFSIIIFLFAFTTAPTSLAQERCATVEQTNRLFQRIQQKQQTDAFEQRVKENTLNKAEAYATQRTQAEPYRIPIVVHVIHNDEPVGIGTNISDEQILSQIKVLNNDFRRMNSDANLTPLSFAGVAGQLDIEFVMARQDPTGQSTSGIIRKKGNKSGYILSDEVSLKAESYWPAKDYLNIWVCNQTDFLGYAQFPVSTLPGLEPYQNTIAATDGVVITYNAFGSIDDGNFNLLTRFNKGRTLTHEVGHFLGLRHIWGDNSNCNTTTDYVDDTPRQNDDTNGCPSHPATSCSNTKMFQNYLDYTNDACMNLFTAGQVSRMEIILNDLRIPRRNSLLTSLGLQSPPGGAQNVALREVISPWPVSCAANNMLKVKFQNLGRDPLTYVRLTYQLNNEAIVSLPQILSPIPLFGYGEISVPITLSNGDHTLAVLLDLPNGADDGNPNDNELSKNFIINAPQASMPTRERFENVLNNPWTTINPNSDNSWETTSTFYNQSIVFQSTDPTQLNTAWLVSPILDFSILNEANIRFDWAYRNSNSNRTTLSLLYTTDCGLNYAPLTEAVLSETTTAFSANEERDWESQVIDLSALSGQPSLRIAFVAAAYLGNPLYLDNFELYAGKASPKLPLDELLAIYPTERGGLNLTFNVEEKQNVVFSIVDMMGRSIAKEMKANTLNQTYTYELHGISTGVYIIQIKADNEYYSRKVFIQGQ